MTTQHQSQQRPRRQHISKALKYQSMRLISLIRLKALSAMRFILTSLQLAWRMILTVVRYLRRSKQPPVIPRPYPITETFRSHLQVQQKKLETDGRILTSEANNTNRAFLNQLFVAGGGILTLSTPILIQQRDLKAIPLYVRTLLAEVIVVAVLSLGFGFVQLFLDRKFFVKNKESNTVIVRAIAQGQVRDLEHLEELFAEHQRFPARSSDVFALLQFVTLTFAAAGFIYAMSYILVTAR